MKFEEIPKLYPYSIKDVIPILNEELQCLYIQKPYLIDYNFKFKKYINKTKNTINDFYIVYCNYSGILFSLCYCCIFNILEELQKIKNNNVIEQYIIDNDNIFLILKECIKKK
jgi:hypothetical protein